MGWAGSNCAVNADDCKGAACFNGAVCVDHLNGYQCECAEGFRGDSCQLETQDCASTPCSHGGHCTEQTASYSCACAVGWEGDNCDVEIETCDPANECSGGCIDECIVTGPGVHACSPLSELAYGICLLEPTTEAGGRRRMQGDMVATIVDKMVDKIDAMMCPTCGMVMTVKEMVGFDDEKLADWKAKIVDKLNEVIPSEFKAKIDAINKLIDMPTPSPTDPGAVIAYAKTVSEVADELMPPPPPPENGPPPPAGEGGIAEKAVAAIGELLGKVADAAETVRPTLSTICTAVAIETDTSTAEEQCETVLAPLTPPADGTDPTIDSYVSAAKKLAEMISARTSGKTTEETIKELLPVIAAILDQEIPALEGKASVVVGLATSPSTLIETLTAEPADGETVDYGALVADIVDQFLGEGVATEAVTTITDMITKIQDAAATAKPTLATICNALTTDAVQCDTAMAPLTPSAGGSTPSIEDYITSANALADIYAASPLIASGGSAAAMMPVVGAIIDSQMPQLAGKATVVGAIMASAGDKAAMAAQIADQLTAAQIAALKGTMDKFATSLGVDPAVLAEGADSVHQLAATINGIKSKVTDMLAQYDDTATSGRRRAQLDLSPGSMSPGQMLALARMATAALAATDAANSAVVSDVVALLEKAQSALERAKAKVLPVLVAVYNSFANRVDGVSAITVGEVQTVADLKDLVTRLKTEATALLTATVTAKLNAATDIVMEMVASQLTEAHVAQLKGVITRFAKNLGVGAYVPSEVDAITTVEDLMVVTRDVKATVTDLMANFGSSMNPATMPVGQMISIARLAASAMASCTVTPGDASDQLMDLVQELEKAQALLEKGREEILPVLVAVHNSFPGNDPVIAMTIDTIDELKSLVLAITTSARTVLTEGTTAEKLSAGTNIVAAIYSSCKACPDPGSYLPPDVAAGYDSLKNSFSAFSDSKVTGEGEATASVASDELSTSSAKTFKFGTSLGGMSVEVTVYVFIMPEALTQIKNGLLAMAAGGASFDWTSVDINFALKATLIADDFQITSLPAFSDMSDSWLGALTINGQIDLVLASADINDAAGALVIKKGFSFAGVVGDSPSGASDAPFLASMDDASDRTRATQKYLQGYLPLDVGLGGVSYDPSLGEGWAPGRSRWGVQGAHLNPLGLFLNPLGLFLRTSIPFVWRFMSAFLPACTPWLRGPVSSFLFFN